MTQTTMIDTLQDRSATEVAITGARLVAGLPGAAAVAESRGLTLEAMSAAWAVRALRSCGGRWVLDAAFLADVEWVIACEFSLLPRVR